MGDVYRWPAERPAEEKPLDKRKSLVDRVLDWTADAAPHEYATALVAAFLLIAFSVVCSMLAVSEYRDACATRWQTIFRPTHIDGQDVFVQESYCPRYKPGRGPHKTDGAQ